MPRFAANLSMMFGEVPFLGRFAADAVGVRGRDMPGYFLNDFNRAAEIVETLNYPCLKLQFDIYHRQILHGDVFKGLTAATPIIGHIQVASVPERHEPGTGELDDFHIFATLDALGYGGWIGCEYRPAGETAAGLGWLARTGAADKGRDEIAAHDQGAFL